MVRTPVFGMHSSYAETHDTFILQFHTQEQEAVVLMQLVYQSKKTEDQPRTALSASRRHQRLLICMNKRKIVCLFLPPAT
jgi:hypothetical protein